MRIFKDKYIIPNWPSLKSIKACCATYLKGVSTGSFVSKIISDIPLGNFMAYRWPSIQQQEHMILAALQGIAKYPLTQADIKQVFIEPACTYASTEYNFPSSRENITGRCATFIWKN